MVGRCDVPEVTGNSHPDKLGIQIQETPSLLSLFLTHAGQIGEAVELCIPLWGQEGGGVGVGERRGMRGVGRKRGKEGGK